VGKQALIACKQVAKERVTGLGSVNPITGQLVVNCEQVGNFLSFKKHLKKILRVYRDKSKIILYVDNVRFHHAKALKCFLAIHPKLEIPCIISRLNLIKRV
jgi:hypothetical protein